MKKILSTYGKAIVVLGFIWFSIRFTGIDLSLLIEGKGQFIEVLTQMVPPDTSYTGKIVHFLLDTITMSIVGTVSGTILALFLSILCSNQFHRKNYVVAVLRFINNLIRTIPALILALLATFLFGIGTFAGTMALLVYTTVILTRIGYEDLDSKEFKAYHAITASGVARSKAFVRTVLIEFLPGFLSNALYLLESNVRQATILGYVGAGGIGLLLNEKIAWRQYHKVGMVLCLLFVVVIFLEAVSMLLLKAITYDGRRKHIFYLIGGVAVAVLYVCSLATTKIPSLQTSSVKIIGALLHGLSHPDLSLLFDLSEQGAGYLLLETISISFLGTLLGAFLAFGCSLLASTKLMPRPIAFAARTVITAIRTVPILIYGFVFIRVVGPGSFAGVLTLAVASIGLLSKRMIIAIDSMDYETYDAMKATGVGTTKCLIRVLIPSILPHLVSAIGYRFDVNMREASILGIVGAGGIGAPLIFAINHYQWSQVGALLIGLIFVLFVIDHATSRTRANTL